MMDNRNVKLQKLKFKLRKAKDSKKKMKRKLKIKFAQKCLKMKAKLSYQKELVRKLKKSAIWSSLQSTTESPFEEELELVSQGAINIHFDSNDEMIENGSAPNDMITDDDIENPVISYDIGFFHSYAKSNDEQQSNMHKCRY